MYKRVIGQSTAFNIEPGLTPDSKRAVKGLKITSVKLSKQEKQWSYLYQKRETRNTNKQQLLNNRLLIKDIYITMQRLYITSTEVKTYRHTIYISKVVKL